VEYGLVSCPGAGNGQLSEAIEQVQQAQPAPLPQSAPPQPLTRQESDAAPTNPLPALPAPDYLLAELTISAGLQQQGLQRVPLPQLHHWLLSVVTTEGPVHIEEAMRRVLDAYGITRLGPRIRTILADAVEKLHVSQRLQRRGDFLWLPDQVAAVHPRSRANVPAGSRKLELIAPEEIDAAVMQVVEHALGMRPDDIPPAACSLLGFGATSERMRGMVNGRVW
jgi:hypothetical protein